MLAAGLRNLSSRGPIASEFALRLCESSMTLPCMRIRRTQFSRFFFALLALAAFIRSAGAAEPPRLKLEKGDHVILIGNTLAERMQYFGNWETLLHSRFPDLQLV